jgi:hypothetical protein
MTRSSGRALRIRLAIYGTLAGLITLGVLWLTQPVFVRSGTNAGPTVSPERLEAHVRMLSETLVPRDADHPENLDKVASYIRDRFIEAGGGVEDQAFPAYHATYRNVIARFGPDSPERVVIGAHYDAFGPLPAADDNASGVAGLLELGRLLGERPPPGRVDLVAYTLEEPPAFSGPFMGSAVHAASLKKAGVRVRAMVSLEMIGCYSEARESQQFPNLLLKLLYPSRGDFVAVVGRLGDVRLVRSVKSAMAGGSPLPVRSINAPAIIPGIDLSDHMNYWSQGYPAVMVTDTAMFRNDHYHTAEDRPETLDYRRMAMVVQDMDRAVRSLCQ